jgi:hypothetical protein
MQRWTDAEFEGMTWHDNHVHALRIVQGEHGSGQLILDIDHILEWLPSAGGGFRFRIARAELRFLEVSSLKMSVDYAAPSAAFGPFALSAIERRTETRPRYNATIWTLTLNWPVGQIAFEATGFEQHLVTEPVVTDRQWLTEGERVAV